MSQFRNKISSMIQCLFLASFAQFTLAATATSELDTKVQALQDDAAQIERDIALLEKELLFPPLTRVEVYLSVAGELKFTVRSIALTIDNEEKTFFIYSTDDVAALRLGGMQQLWEGNVALGEHNLLAKIQGVSANGDTIEESATLAFTKKKTGLALELQVLVGKNDKTPKFAVKNWGEK